MSRKHKRGRPVLPAIKEMVQAGVDPVTKLPLKLVYGKGCRKGDIKRVLRIMDEQDAVNRFTWKNLPGNITGQELERMLYLKGQVILFKAKDGRFYFAPYTLDGTIDFYGRYNYVRPISLGNGNDEKPSGEIEPVDQELAKMHLRMCYTKEDVERYKDKEEIAIPLWDYSKEFAQTIRPRYFINDPLIDLEAECPALMQTALYAGTGVTGVRVTDADQAEAVYEAVQSMRDAALNHEQLIPIAAPNEFQELSGGKLSRASEFMLAMQAIDNFRLSTYGITNGGLFEKKAHMNDSENNLNTAGSSSKLIDGQEIRKNFCEMANLAFGLDTDCEASELCENMAVADQQSQEGGAADGNEAN